MIHPSSAVYGKSESIDGGGGSKRKVNFRNWLEKSLKSYCDTTSLHGFGYINKKGATRSERMFWTFIVAISIVVSVILVMVSWSWNQETPTVTVIETSHYPTWNVPFPAVTICNFNKLSKARVTTMLDKLQRPANMTRDDLAKLFRIIMYYGFGFKSAEEDYIRLQTILDQNNYTAGAFVDDVVPNCIDMISRCVWKGTSTRCDSLFQKINTSEGLCCSFNYFGLKTNNFPTKLAYQIPSQPYRVTGCGYPTGLTILLNPAVEDYFGTYLSSYGFRLLIHNSYDYPDENAETKVLTSARESFVRITPESSYATQYIRNMDKIARNCLFDDERKLGVMQRYSYVNCLSECRSKLIFEKCGCVPQSLPSSGNTPICNFTQINCVSLNKEIIIGALPGLNDSIIRTSTTAMKPPCDCMPDCELNQYSAEITMGKLNMDYTNTNNMLKGVEVNNQILLHVYFSDLMSTRYRKDIYQNWLSSLASFGGLLGLIMGFSIVTAFEFLYYFTIRPIFDLYF